MLHLKFFKQSILDSSDQTQAPKIIADYDEQSIRIRSAVRSLPRKYREPVVLKYLNEMPSDQISDVLGITKNTLHVRLNRSTERRHAHAPGPRESRALAVQTARSGYAHAHYSLRIAEF